MKKHVIIVAGGKGLRMGGDIETVSADRRQTCADAYY